MNRLIASVIVLLTMGQSHAQLPPPSRILQQVSNPTNVFMDRGAKLEIFPLSGQSHSQATADVKSLIV